jgi:hypothetical protein
MPKRIVLEFSDIPDGDVDAVMDKLLAATEGVAPVSCVGQPIQDQVDDDRREKVSEISDLLMEGKYAEAIGSIWNLMIPMGPLPDNAEDAGPGGAWRPPMYYSED